MAPSHIAEVIDMGNIAIPHLFTEDPFSDPYACLGFTRNPDGSFTRQFEFPTLPASSYPAGVTTKDVTINQENKTWVRIFLPTSQVALDPSEITKLPLIIEFHGGGFVSFSLTSTVYQHFYPIITTEIPAVIVSVEYRRAPEHRLPAAYDDGMEALHWIKKTKEEWLIKYADLSNCFLMGNSAGANLAYNVGLRASSSVDDLLPLHIKGLILLDPFFGGTERMPSELREHKLFPPSIADVCWEMSLPIGADRDHEYCNPTVGIKNGLLDQIKRLGWKVLVKGYHNDHLIDRQVEFAKVLEENGVQVVSKFEEGGYHGVDVMEPDRTKALIHLITQLMIHM